MSIRPPKPRAVPLEVAVFSGAAALQAQTLGASRIKLNSPGSYVLGGLTPSVDELAAVSSRLAIPVHVMIRPRPALQDGGPDFIYSHLDFARIIEAILAFKCAGVLDPVRGDRFVFGALREVDDDDGTSDLGLDDDRVDGPCADVSGRPALKRLVVDEKMCEALIQMAKPMGCVFHRAFDSIAASSPRRCIQAFERLTVLGFDALLTAGSPSGSCCDQHNIVTLDILCRRARSRPLIIAGGGLRSHNVAAAITQLAVYANRDGEDGNSPLWFHTAAVKAIDGVPTEDLDVDELHSLLVQLGSIEPA